MDSFGVIATLSTAASQTLHVLDEIRSEIVLFIAAILIHRVFAASFSTRNRPRKKAYVEAPCEPEGACSPKQGATPVPGQASQRDFSTFASPQQPREAPKDVTARLTQEIKRHASEGALHLALRLFHSAQARGFVNALVRPMLEACIECGDADQAEIFLSRMCDMCYAGTAEYAAVIRLQLEQGNCAAGRKTFDKMLASGIRPCVSIYHDFLAACDKYTEKPRAWQQMLRMLDEMKVHGLSPNRGTCTLLLRTLDRNSPKNFLVRVMDVVDNLGDDADEALVASCAEASMRVGQTWLVKERLASVHAKHLSQVTSPTTLGILIKAHGYVGDVQGAWDCWGLFRAHHIRPTSVAVGCMVEAVVSNGDVKGGHNLILALSREEECKSQINSVIYGSVLKGYSRARQMKQLWAAYNEMLASGIQPSAVTFNLLIDACARNGDINKVPSLLSDMQSRGFEPNLITYSTVVKGYCSAGDINAGMEILAELRKTNLQPDEILYNTLIDGCAQFGCVADGERIFKEMLDAGVTPTSYTLTRMVRLLGQAKRLEDAFNLASDLVKRFGVQKNVHIYGSLIHACLASREVTRALELFDDMTREGFQPDTRLVHNLILAALNGGVHQKAVALLHKVPGAAPLLDDDAFLNKVFGYLMRDDAGHPPARKLAADLRKRKPRSSYPFLVAHGL